MTYTMRIYHQLFHSIVIQAAIYRIFCKASTNHRIGGYILREGVYELKGPGVSDCPDHYVAYLHLRGGPDIPLALVRWFPPIRPHVPFLTYRLLAGVDSLF